MSSLIDNLHTQIRTRRRLGETARAALSSGRAQVAFLSVSSPYRNVRTAWANPVVSAAYLTPICHVKACGLRKKGDAGRSGERYRIGTKCNDECCKWRGLDAPQNADSGIHTWVRRQRTRMGAARKSVAGL